MRKDIESDAMLSFIVATLNEEKNIDRLLSGLAPQLESGDEIIIVDSYSTDKTAEVAKSHGARVVLQPKKGIGLAKTEGANKAKNDVLVFLDADCLLSQDYAKRLRNHFSDPKIQAVGGLDLYSSDSDAWKAIYNGFSRAVFHGSRMLHRLSGKYYFPANNAAYRKGPFFKAGGFRSVVCEDMDLMVRLPASRDVRYDSGLVAVLSDRRFRESGFFRTVLMWAWSDIKAAAGSGCSTEGYRKG